ncbi:uncharacterized protein [Nothobranchius furzeri]|uniref:uncharacterized protein isoform X1 n=1 Tax=Nothobranchius furzeri TaxID=105023 RepID=UPI0039048C58
MARAESPREVFGEADEDVLITSVDESEDLLPGPDSQEMLVLPPSGQKPLVNKRRQPGVMPPKRVSLYGLVDGKPVRINPNGPWNAHVWERIVLVSDGTSHKGTRVARREKILQRITRSTLVKHFDCVRRDVSRGQTRLPCALSHFREGDVDWWWISTPHNDYVQEGEEPRRVVRMQPSPAKVDVPMQEVSPPEFNLRRQLQAAPSVQAIVPPVMNAINPHVYLYPGNLNMQYFPQFMPFNEAWFQGGC